MAAVYLARDLALNRRVAIKVMAPGLLLGQGMIERFRREAVTVANLQHAHIVSIYAVRQHADLHYFIMQFVPGRTLEGVLRDAGALPIPVVRAWLYQVGSALGYAHRRGVIHRDIKPGNILLNADGEAVVTDFGIAKVAETPNQTQTGTVVGTPIYMSPEQCYARELTGASDQYSLGVVAYEMLAGRPPFQGSSFVLMRSHTDTPPPPLREVRGDIPPDLEAAVMRMLAKSADLRFPSLADALASLGAAPLSPDSPLHADLQRFAAASDRLERLADVIQTPASPVPMTRERPKAATAAPTAPAEVAEPPRPAAVEPARPAPAKSAVAAGASKGRGHLRWIVPAALAASAAVYVAMRPPSPSVPAADPVVATRPDSQVAIARPAAPNAPPAATESTAVRDSTVASNTANSTPAVPRRDTATVSRTSSPPPAPRQAETRPTRPDPKKETTAQARTGTPAATAAAETDAPPPRPTTPTESAPAPTATKPATAEAPKTEAEHRTEIQNVVASYARAIEQRDTSLIRRAFPGAGSELMSRWQATFDDARGPIAMTGGTVEILDTPRDAAGSQVHARAKYLARLSSKAARSEQSFPVSFTAVLQRDAGAWRITSIR
jgi:serine/threonine-protein kinase